MTSVVAAELTQEPGFLSWVGMEIGSRLYTITAWESQDAVRAIMRNGTHLAAVKRRLTEDFAAVVCAVVAERNAQVSLRSPAGGPTPGRVDVA